MFDATNIPVSGASIYAKREGSEEDGLGTLLGLTGSGSFGTAGYLKTYLIPGSYQLNAKYVPIDGTAQEDISLNAFDVKNQDLFLTKYLIKTILPVLPLPRLLGMPRRTRVTVSNGSPVMPMIRPILACTMILTAETTMVS